MPLWNPDAVVPRILIENRRDVTIVSPEPARDAARMAQLKRLRHRMVTLCSQNNKSKNKPPVLAFERWLSRAALRREIAKKSSADPIIPDDGEICIGLIKDLSRSLSSEAARSVAEAMAVDASKAAEKVASLPTKGSIAPESAKQIKEAAKAVKKASKLAHTSLREQDESLETTLATLKVATKSLENCTSKIQRYAGYGDLVKIDCSRRPGIFDVSLIGPYGRPKKPYLTISTPHLLKLLDLWTRKRQNTTEEKVTINSIAKRDPLKIIETLGTDRISFSNSLFCCLARYEALQGKGYQCAVPGIAFDAAAEKCGLGTTIECFASPLNCRYTTYCSAFPDIEHSFGSLGSFFDDAFFPLEGSFEANPPFVPETMSMMGAKLDRLLSNKDAKELSFLVVVPAWGAGIQFCEDLESSKFVRANTRVPAASHAYCDGAQHNRVIRGDSVDLRPSSWDTAVILLQNNLGAARWPVRTKMLEESFCAAFHDAAQNLPSEFTTIAKWEKRGVGKGGKGGHTSSYNNEPNKRPRY